MTTIVQASQLIYSRVEPAYSAQRKGGFQTVYKTPLITAAEVEAIERRVQSFMPLNVTQVRYQYFPLDSGAVVLTHSCRIESHRAITDAEGRTGAFIAHCLILSPAEFAKVDHNPFALIGCFSFIQDPVTMVQSFGQATGLAPAVAITVAAAFPPIDLPWTGNEAEKLVMLAEAAPTLRKEGQSVQILGETPEVLATLALLFQLMRRQTRLLCSFDVSVEQATVKPGDYWAIGRPQRQARIAYYIHAAQRCVIEAIEQPLPTADLYLAWLKHALATQPLALVSTKAPLMQTLAKSFTDQTPPVANEVDPIVYAEFATMHQAYITQRLQIAFRQFVRPELATTLTRHVLNRWAPTDNLPIAVRQQLDPKLAADLILTWIEENKPQLDDKAWSQLQLLAQQAVNLPLLYLASTLRKKTDHKVQQETLAQLDREMFQRLLPWLLDPVAPADLVASAHLPLLLDDNRLTQMTNEQTVDLIESVVQIDGVRQLDALAPYVSRLEQKGLPQAEKIVSKWADTSTQFQNALVKRREQLGSPSFFNWILRRG